MASISKSRSLGKVLLRQSLDEDGLINKTKAVESIKELHDLNLSYIKEILRHFLAEVRNHLRLHQAQVEIGCLENVEVKQKIRRKFDAIAGRKIDLSIQTNPELLAGYRIRIGDDVYEDSISRSLENLKKSLL